MESCRRFEQGLYAFIDNAHPSIWAQLREKKALDETLRADLQNAVKEFKEVLRQRPNHAEAKKYLDAALARAG